MEGDINEIKLIIDKKINSFPELLNVIKKLKRWYFFDTRNILREYKYYNYNKVFIDSKCGIYGFSYKIDQYLIKLIEENKTITYDMVVKSIKEFVEDIFSKLFWIVNEHPSEFVIHNKLDPFEERPENVKPIISFYYDYLELREAFYNHFFVEHSLVEQVDFTYHLEKIAERYPSLKSIGLVKTQQLNRAEIELSNQSNDSSKLWFKVGVLFANGKIEKLYNLTNSFSQVAIELGNKNYRPYISESWGNTNIGNKNIFSNKKRVEIIKEYCLDNNIELSESFKCRTSK